jgi:hypothetical protein
LQLPPFRGDEWFGDQARVLLARSGSVVSLLV